MTSSYKENYTSEVSNVPHIELLLIKNSIYPSNHKVQCKNNIYPSKYYSQIVHWNLVGIDVYMRIHNVNRRAAAHFHDQPH